MTTCTADYCDQPTDLYLCNQCVKELTRAMNQIPDLLPVLGLIGRKEEKSFTSNISGGRGGSSGPTTPLNLSAIALAQNLTMAQNKTAGEYAQDPDGAWAKTYIETQVAKADTMVNGEEEKTMTPDYIAYRMKQVLPMPSKTLIPWFAETMGIHLTDGRIRKWVERGKLSRVNTGNGHPHYHPADVLRAHQNTRK